MIAFFEKIITITDPSGFTFFETAVIMLVGGMLVFAIMPMLIFEFIVHPDRFVNGIIDYVDRIKKEFSEDE